MSAAPAAVSGTAPGAAPGGWRTPLLIIVCGCLLSFIAFGVRSGTGLFLEPISRELHWGRGVFAFSVALQMLIWGAGVPVAGVVADKYGPGRVLAVGALLYGAGWALMSTASQPWHMHLAAGVLVGLGLAGTSFTIVLAVLARLVRPQRRTLVVGVCTAVTSLGQFVILPLGQTFISNYGWHMAAILLGGVALLMLPFSTVIRGSAAPPPGVVDQPLREALGEAMGHRSFVLLVLGFFVCGFQLFFILNHLPAYISDKGLDIKWASRALALVGLTNVIGGVLAGYVGVRWPKRIGLATIYLSRSALTILFILLPISPATVMIYGGMMGVLWLSTVPLTQGLVLQFFGLRWLATLFGIAFFSHQVGGFFGVWLGGLLFDAYHSYDVVWWINIALGVVAALLHMPIREAPTPRLAAAG
jgi:MFS family permease